MQATIIVNVSAHLLKASPCELIEALLSERRCLRLANVSAVIVVAVPRMLQLTNSLAFFCGVSGPVSRQFRHRCSCF